MNALDSVSLLLVAADRIFYRANQQMSDIVKRMDGAQTDGQASLADDLQLATIEVEVAAVGIVSLFESRMQQRFKRGPFFVQLQKSLNTAGKADLADRVYAYYLAINVLKHGRGKSYDELLALDDAPAFVTPNKTAQNGLVDVRANGFTDGLVETLKHAHQFLASR